MKYGYIDMKTVESQRSSPLTSSDGLRSYIEEFQAFANLSVTGELDSKTVEMMERPRCGVKDIVGHGSRRERRYALQGEIVSCSRPLSHTRHFQGRAGRCET
jgi:hypothetical protein